MRILIANDDGIASEGLRALAAACAARHEVYIAAPWHEQSGMAHALNVHRPIEVEEMPGVALELGAVAAWRIAGTPTDCVKLYLEALMDANRPIDLVLSGINRGANLATDVLYSGTVGAAMEGFLPEIAAAAISLDIEADYADERGAERVVLPQCELPAATPPGGFPGEPPRTPRLRERVPADGAAGRPHLLHRRGRDQGL